MRALLVAILGLLASGAAALASPPAVPAEAHAVTSLSAVETKRLGDALSDDGVDQHIPSGLVRQLNLGQRAVRQLGLIDKTTGDMHAFARLYDGGYLLTFIDVAKTKSAYTYRLDAGFKLVAAVTGAKDIYAAIADPQSGGQAELAYWASVADQL